MFAHIGKLLYLCSRKRKRNKPITNSKTYRLWKKKEEFAIAANIICGNAPCAASAFTKAPKK